MREYDWYVDLGSYPVTWQEHGDEWLHWLGICVEEQGSLRVLGHTLDATTRPFLAVRLRDVGGEESTSVLLVAAQADEIRPVVAGDGHPDERTIGLLRTSVICASTRLGDEGTEFEWSAIVGYQRERIGGGEQRLAGTAEVGGLHLVSSEKVFTEADDTFQASLHAWGVNQSVPIVVYGRSKGYSWEVASVQAASQLHLLVGLLSLGWDTCNATIGGSIVVRESPAPINWGVRSVPASQPWQDSARLGGNESQGELSRIPAVALPGWFAGAWERLEELPGLRDSLAGFHEGVRASIEHPSLALVSFIASIEAIGTMIFKPGRCPHCGTHQDVTKRFRATLRRAVDAEEATFLGTAYEPRSRTVHSGQLHGGEGYRGANSSRLWRPPPGQQFRWDLLRRMQTATRALLRDALESGLPKRVEFEPGGAP